MMSISKLSSQYFQHLDPLLLAIPNGPTLLSPAVQNAIFESMFDDSSAWPLPPPNYQARVLKLIIARIEQSISDPDEDEISDALIQKLTSLLCAPKPHAIDQAQQLNYTKYTAPTIPPSEIITLESRTAILSAGTTGFRTWEAALHLATYLCTTRAGSALVNGKRVLELGAGTGFISMFCARHLGARFAYATDIAAALIEGMRDSSAKNGLNGENFQAGLLEWGSSSNLGYGEEDEKKDKMDFDVVLGADLIYDTDLHQLLLSTLIDLFTKYSIQEFILSTTLRNRSTFNAFVDSCRNSMFHIERVPFQSPREKAQMGFYHSTGIPIETFRITRAGNGSFSSTEMDASID